MTVDIPARAAALPTQWGRDRGSVYPIASYRPPTRHTLLFIGGMSLSLSMWITGSIPLAVVVAVCVVAAAIAVHYLVEVSRRHVAAAAAGIYSVDSIVDGTDAVVFHDIAAATVTVVWAVELDAEHPHDGPRPELDWARHYAQSYGQRRVHKPSPSTSRPATGEHRVAASSNTPPHKLSTAAHWGPSLTGYLTCSATPIERISLSSVH